jgi:hypothetical protein
MNYRVAGLTRILTVVRQLVAQLDHTALFVISILAFRPERDAVTANDSSHL